MPDPAAQKDTSMNNLDLPIDTDDIVGYFTTLSKILSLTVVSSASGDSNELRRDEAASGFDVPEPVEEPSDAPQAPEAPQAPKAPEEDDQQ